MGLFVDGGQAPCMQCAHFDANGLNIFLDLYSFLALEHLGLAGTEGAACRDYICVLLGVFYQLLPFI